MGTKVISETSFGVVSSCVVSLAMVCAERLCIAAAITWLSIEIDAANLPTTWPDVEYESREIRVPPVSVINVSKPCIANVRTASIVKGKVGWFKLLYFPTVPFNDESQKFPFWPIFSYFVPFPT